MFVISFGFNGINAQTIRCHTDEMEKIRRVENPDLETHEQFEKWMAEQIRQNSNKRVIGGVYTIPVVFHVINNGEAIGTGSNVSQAAIQSQIDILNEDFRKKIGSHGYNTNAVGADSQIEFCLAQRRPDGSAFTTGQAGVNRINRTTAGFSAPPYSDTYVDATIKPYTYNNGVVSSTRGWSPNKYLNIWLCNLTGGILGYAQFPESPIGGIGCGATSLATDGVVFMYNSIGKSSVTHNAAPYNEGRTATHEIGHWLGLRHIWGDATGTCGLDDFCNDTPIAADANYSCPTGTNSCTAFPGNDMIENYMDYTDDLCMNVFTNDQKTRMRIVLEATPMRMNLINSDACTPPNPNDASIVDILNPLGDNCIGSIIPTVVLKNRGSSNLTSATISYSIDNGTVVTFAYSGTIAPGSSANVNLPSFTAFAGTHTIKSFSTLPNGTVDPSTLYDTTSLTFIVSNGIVAPYVQNFEANVFPPDLKWTVNNVNSDCYEWLGASATSISGVAINKAAQMPSFRNATGGTENLITPIFILPCNASVANIQFDVAYRRKNTSTSNYEKLYVDISEDCGSTWTATPIYNKLGTALQVLTSVLSSEYIPVGASDWRTETIDLMPFVTSSSKNVKFRFRAVAANGNNIYIDNFKFNATSPTEINVTQTGNDILDGGGYNFATIASGTTSTSTFTIKNSGSSNLTLNSPISITGTSFAVSTTFGSTTIAPGVTTTFVVSFNPASGGVFSETLSFTTNDCDEGTYNFLLNGNATGPAIVNPIANYTPSLNSSCSGQTITFTNTSTGSPTSYSWSFPGGTPSTSIEASPVVTYSTSGNYSVTLIATNVNGSNTLTNPNSITINDLPIVSAISGGNTVCTGSNLVLSNVTTGGTWSSSASNIASVSTIGLVSGLTFGTSVISYTKTVNGCTSVQNSTITVNTTPLVAPITGVNTVCLGTSTTFSNTTLGGTWTSSIITNATISSTGIVTTLLQGSSDITYSVTSQLGCTATQIVNLIIGSMPIVEPITGVNTICEGSSTNLNSLTAGGVWSSSDPTRSVVTNSGVLTGVSNGSSVISYTVTNNGCVAIQTFPISISISPDVTATSGNTSVCLGETSVLSNATMGGTWTSLSPLIANVSNDGLVTSLTSGASIIRYSVTAIGCTTNKDIVFTVNSLPSVSLSTIPLICSTWNSYSLSQGLPLGGQYSGLGIMGNIFTPISTGNSIVSYSYTDANSCTNTVQSTINVQTCAGIKELATSTFIVYPNPAKNFVKIVSDNEDIKEIKLYDNTGRLIASQNVFGIETELDLVNYANGCYTLCISSDNKTINTRISINK